MRFIFVGAVFRRRCTTFSLVLLLAAAPLACAAQSTLTLSEAQRLAAERSRQLVAQDSAVLASREMATAAGQLPDPALKIGIDNLPVNGPDQFSVTRDFMTMRRIGLMQEFTREEKRQLRSERFEREAERTLAEKSATLAAIQRDTALAWLDRYYAEATAAVVAEQVKEARLEIEAAESAYRGGRGGQADIFAARSAVVALEDRSSEIGRRIRTAKTALARWIGAAADIPLAGKPDIDVVRLDPRAALDGQLAHHPQITTLTKQVEIAATEAKLAQANKKSDWSLEVMYSQRGSAYSNMVSVGVAIPLQWDQKNRQDRELAAKLALTEQAEAQRDDALRAHVAEVSAMIQEWENLRERRARYERELLPLASNRTRAVLTAYRGGRAALADVLAARRREIEVRMQALQLEMDNARLWAQINFLFPDDAAAHHVGGTPNSSTNVARGLQ
jgi:outer membrane protein TolC